MKIDIYKFLSGIMVFLFLFTSPLSALSTGKIIGTVKQEDNGEKLWGTNIIVLGTGLGASTDLNGNFSISNLPFGNYKLKVSYLGFETKEISVEINSEKTIEINIELKLETIEGETVTITAQREGQLAAINKQISSDAIKNVVAADKIEELPEANAAEAVGRLPGVSLEREGGEGSKVVIRGLAPKYNKIQIDGVDMAATDSDDRSTDLSMISPYLLGGIEVTKSAMADQEADQLGGTVNFITRGALYVKPSYKLIVEGGYNGLKSNYNDYRLAAQTSRRMFENKFGLSLNLDVEKRDRSSQNASSDYHYLTEDKLAVANSLHVEDITRNLNRYGGSLLIDYKTESTYLYLSNMLSRVNRKTTSRSENTNGIFNGSSSRSQLLNYSESNTTIFMNQLKLTQNIGSLIIDAGVSYSYSKDNTPEELSYGGLEQTPLSGAVPKNVKPSDIPNFMKNDISSILLSSFTDSDALTKETEFGSYLNFEIEYALTDNINLKLKTGGKYKHKFREYDYNELFLNVFSDPSNIVNNALIAKYPWMADYYTTGKFPYLPFLDDGFNSGEFLDNEYKVERIPKYHLGIEALHYLEDYLGVDWDGSTQPDRFTPNFHDSKRYDYNGKEDYMAWYFMPTISIGEDLTFIPGFRYEHNKTEYTGIRGDGSKKFPSVGYDYKENTITRKNDFYLPMIHLRYKAFEWADVRFSYTQTLSRPSYSEFLPSWHIDGPPLSLTYSNPNLKPAKSENFDLYFSFYGNKVGLFTIGLFSKSIDDLIFSQNQIIINDSMAVADFGLTEEETGKDPGTFKGKPIWSFINNKNKTKLRGIEVEWQSNLWYLPGFLKNVVFGINYTYTFSDVKYPRTVPIKEVIPSPFGNRYVTVGNADSSFSAPLIQQPDHILNITLGYDYLDFSIRASLQFKSQIFAENDWRTQLRAFTDDFTLIDLAVSQKLPIEGLEIFGNVKNLTKTIESDFNSGTGYMSNKEYYGLNGSIGIKYNL